MADVFSIIPVALENGNFQLTLTPAQLREIKCIIDAYVKNRERSRERQREKRGILPEKQHPSLKPALKIITA